MPVGFPLLGTAPLFPWKRGAITIADISDAGAEGAAVLATTTPAAARTALGLSDITSELTAALARASALCTFAKTPKVWAWDSVSKIGTLGSRWTPLLSASAAVRLVTAAGTIGGVNECDTGAASGGYVQLISCVNGLVSYGTPLMPDLVGAASKWYLRFYLKLPTVPDAQTEGGFGWIDPGGNVIMGVGVQGSVDATKFRAFKSGGAGVSSTVAIEATAWHLLEAWGNGDTKIYLATDSEAGVSASGLTWGQPAVPYFTFTNGTTLAAQKPQISTGFYITEGQV